MFVFAPTDANSLSGEWRNIALGFKFKVILNNGNIYRII